MKAIRAFFASILAWFKKPPAPTGVQPTAVTPGQPQANPITPQSLGLVPFPPGTVLLEKPTAASLYGFVPPPNMADPVYLIGYGWYTRSTVKIAPGAASVVPAPSGGIPDATDHFGTLLEFNGSDYHFDPPGKTYKMPAVAGWHSLSVSDGYDAVSVSVRYSNGDPVVDFSGWGTKSFQVVRPDTLTVVVASTSKGTIERQTAAPNPGA